MAGLGQGFYVIGTQYQLSIVPSNTNAPITLGGKRKMFTFDAKDKVIEDDVTDNGGLVTSLTIPGGYKGSIDLQKTDSGLDAFVAFLDLNYYSGLPPVYSTITFTEPNASLTNFEILQFTFVQFHGYKGGSRKRGEIVEMSIEWDAQQMLKIL